MNLLQNSVPQSYEQAIGWKEKGQKVLKYSALRDE